MKKKLIAIPVEIATREIDAKILLSYLLVNKGFDVIIGNNHDLRIFVFRIIPNIYISHTLCMRKKFSSLMKYIGISLVGWDEEGLMWPNEKYYIKKRLDKYFLENLDLIFCWGDKQKNAIKRIISNNNNNIYVVGNPRIDILKNKFKDIYKRKADSIKNKYGEYILINSNFASINHYASNRFKPTIKHSKGYLSERKLIFKEFISLIKILEKYTDYNIIIRPHPSESEVLWKILFGNSKRINIVFDKDLIPWLLSCKYLIHNNCTTAIEYFLLNKKPIFFKPIKTQRFVNDLSEKVSYVINSKNEMLDYLCDNENKEINKIDFEYIRKYISIYDKLSSELISYIIEEKYLSGNINIHTELPEFGILKIFKYLSSNIIYIMLKCLDISKRIFIPSYRNKMKYIYHKFDGVDTIYIQNKLDYFHRKLGLKKCVAKRISNNIWKIRMLE